MRNGAKIMSVRANASFVRDVAQEHGSFGKLLAKWPSSDERRLLEARMGKQGKREFVQVLRLMEVFRADEVAAAVRNAIARGAIGFDAVKHLVLCRIERRPPRLDMTVYPYLPQAHVAMTSAKTYLGLLTGAAS